VNPAGDVRGSLVYVNYGRVEDLQQLASLGVNLTGHIAIARYLQQFASLGFNLKGHIAIASYLRQLASL
jgi:hypothetical protein